MHLSSLGLQPSTGINYLFKKMNSKYKYKY